MGSTTLIRYGGSSFCGSTVIARSLPSSVRRRSSRRVAARLPRAVGCRRGRGGLTWYASADRYTVTPGRGRPSRREMCAIRPTPSRSGRLAIAAMIRSSSLLSNPYRSSSAATRSRASSSSLT